MTSAARQELLTLFSYIPLAVKLIFRKKLRQVDTNNCLKDEENGS